MTGMWSKSIRRLRENRFAMDCSGVWFLLVAVVMNIRFEADIAAKKMWGGKGEADGLVGVGDAEGVDGGKAVATDEGGGNEEGELVDELLADECCGKGATCFDHDGDEAALVERGKDGVEVEAALAEWYGVDFCAALDELACMGMVEVAGGGEEQGGCFVGKEGCREGKPEGAVEYDAEGLPAGVVAEGEAAVVGKGGGGGGEYGVVNGAETVYFAS